MAEQDNEDVGTTNSYEEWKAAISSRYIGPLETPEFVQRHTKFMTSPVARVDGVTLLARTMKADSFVEIEEFMKYHDEVGNEVYLFVIQDIANSSDWMLDMNGDVEPGYYFRAAIIDNQLAALRSKYEAQRSASE